MNEPAHGILSRLSLTARLILALTVSGACIFAVVFSVNYAYTSRMVEQQVMAHAQDVVKAAVQSIDALLQGVVRDQKYLLGRLEDTPQLSSRQIKKLLHNHLLVNDEIFGTTVAFEPGAASEGQKRFAPYYHHRLDGSIGYTNLAAPSYDYLSREWYTNPKQQQTSIWTEPYFDEGGGNVVMTTYAVPFSRLSHGAKRIVGIATADVSVDWLGQQVSSLRLYRNGYASLFSRKGVYLAHPDRSLILKETIFSVAKKLNSPAIQEIGNAIARQETGFVKDRNIYGIESWIYYAPVPTTGWSLAVIFPAREMLADVRAASRMIALVCAGGFVVLVLSIVLVARSVTRPIIAMTAAAERVAAGNLDTVLPPARIGGEVGALSAAFIRMQGDLKDYIIRLTETTAARERMASELAVAHDLQMSMLPNELPQLAEVKLAGSCQPAREVGGDLYDVRLLDDDRLFFIIGDVSGKGVPAALYMAITVSLARAIIQEGAGPAEVLTRINRELSRSNDACMFVTVFCGVLDCKTGQVRYANAGHNPPVMISSGGTATLMKIKPGIVVGCLDEYDYNEAACLLDPGATLLLYTDGVTEALDTKGTFFGEEQLLTAAGGKTSAQETVAAVKQAVADFAAEAAQADDITLLAISRQKTIPVG